MKRLAVVSIAFLVGAGAAFAQSEGTNVTLSTTSKQSVPPDFSRKSLLEIFRETDVGTDQPPPSAFDGGIVLINSSPLRMRWVPFLAPLFMMTSTSSYARFTPGGSLTVDPFTLTHNTFPYTPETARDPFREWRFRRMLKQNEEAAKKARGES
jgi:hypothetical protein